MEDSTPVIINNEEDYRVNYPYKYSVPKIFPEHYPCILEYEKVELGLSGEAYEITLMYPPEGVDIQTFYRCLTTDNINFIV